MRFVLLLISWVAMAGDFSTALGDQYPYAISAITTDPAGSTYVVGSRQIGVGAFRIGVIAGNPTATNTTNYGVGSDVFVSKLDPNGKLIFTDTFGGKGNDIGTAIAVDPAGNIYIAGFTSSTDFPLSKALQTLPGNGNTGFVMKLSNDGSTILYSTFFGGTLGVSAATSLATDAQGNLYLTGTTTSADFPHTTGMPFGPNPLVSGNTAVFMTSMSAAGDKILFSAALISGPIPTGLPFSGASVSPSAAGVAVDASGNAYFAGNLGKGIPPTPTPGVLPVFVSFTGFAMKINSGGGLGYLTPLPTMISAMAVDPAGDLYYAGYMRAQFVDKLNPTASAILWSFYNGAAFTITSLASDPSGGLWATGTSAEGSFPNQGWTTGTEFLAKLDSSGNLTYSTLNPAGTTDAVVVDPTGLPHVAGNSGFVTVTNSSLPSQQIGYFTSVFGGSATARISPAEVISVYGPGIGPSTPVTASPTGGFFPTTLSGVQVTINGADMPVLYASANQINAIVPMGIVPGVSASVRVINGSVTAAFPVWIDTSAAQALPTVLNQDGSVNSQSNPATLNSIVTFYATGWQSYFQGLADGQVATTAQNLCVPVLSCQVVPVNTVPLGVAVYAGPAPGIVAGVSQFNVLIGTGNAIVVSSNVVGPYTFSVTGSGYGAVSQTVWVKL